jgi:hypothetical protein
MRRTMFKSDLPTRQQLKARKARRERAVIKAVRSDVAGRDGPCRLMAVHGSVTGYCGGVPEMAHLGEWRRANTRGLDPEDRHHTRGCLMLCTKHHRAYDAHEFDLGYGPLGADGRLDVILRKAVA